MTRKILGSLVAGALLSTPALARAQETWLLNAAGSVAAPINDPYNDDFGAGATGEVGVYHSLGHIVQLGGRFSAGGLEDDGTTTQNADPGNMGIGWVGPAVRVRPLARASDPNRATGLWIEGAAGPGIVENDVEPVLSPAVGYVIPAGDIGVGPIARYVHAVEPAGRFGGEDARIGTLGIEVVFFDNRRRLEQPRPEEYEPGAPMMPAARLEPAARVDPDADRDGIPLGRDQCPSQPETVNGINDHDGCPDSELAFLNDRLIMDEHVFFDYDKADIRPEGREVLRQVASLYDRTGYDWQKLRVQGYADARGPQSYNVALSQRRAEAVERELESLGVPESRLDLEAYGEAKPVIPNADTEREHQQNRRVEFVIVRK
jgi:outer membrane protein OmpA-like peptidoglycan-associated protein